MTEELTTCRGDTNLAAATGLMWDNDQRVLPVLTPSRKLLGMLWDRDICIALGTRNVRASDLTAIDVIRPGAPTCQAGDSIRHALQLMRDKRSRCLAVAAHDATFEAIVSIDDIVVYAARRSGRPDQAVSSIDTATVLAAIGGRYCPMSIAGFPVAA